MISLNMAEVYRVTDNYGALLLLCSCGASTPQPCMGYSSSHSKSCISIPSHYGSTREGISRKLLRVGRPDFAALLDKVRQIFQPSVRKNNLTPYLSNLRLLADIYCI